MHKLDNENRQNIANYKSITDFLLTRGGYTYELHMKLISTQKYWKILSSLSHLAALVKFTGQAVKRETNFLAGRFDSI